MPRDHDHGDGSSLFIRNLSSDTKEHDLRVMFQKYGPLRDVYIPLDYHSKKPRGFAYVQFEDYRDAKDAVRHEDGTELNGQSLSVRFAYGDRKTPHEMRRRERRSSRDSRRRYSRSPQYYRDSRRRHNNRSSSREHYRRRRSRSRSASRDGRDD